MEPSERWSIRVDDGVFVVEFPHGTGLSPADGEALLARWRTLASDTQIDALVIVVRTSRPCSDAGRRAVRESAQLAVARGASKFAVVGEPSKRQYLQRAVTVEDVDVEPFNDSETALEWAKCRSEPCLSVESSPS